MLKVNLTTLVATREAPPKNIRGLAAVSLQNLQTAIDPVPENVLGVEWWPEVYTPQVFDEAVKYVSGEVFMADIAKKTIIVTDVLSDYTVAELAERAAAYEVELVQAYGDAVQVYLDAAAKQYEYSSIYALCAPSVTFADEAAAGVEFRDACWAHVKKVRRRVKAGNLTMPTIEELIAGLPALVWP
jgi:hypothetical protein